MRLSKKAAKTRRILRLKSAPRHIDSTPQSHIPFSQSAQVGARLQIRVIAAREARFQRLCEQPGAQAQCGLYAGARTRLHPRNRIRCAGGQGGRRCGPDVSARRAAPQPGQRRACWFRARFTSASKTSATAASSLCSANIEIELEELYAFPASPVSEFSVGEDGILDLGPLLRDEAIIADTRGMLCRPDCKGLCPDCGANLNEGPHECAEAIDPRAGQAARTASGRMISGAASRRCECAHSSSDPMMTMYSGFRERVLLATR